MLMLEYNSLTEPPKNPKNEGLTLNSWGMFLIEKLCSKEEICGKDKWTLIFPGPTCWSQEVLRKEVRVYY